MKNCVGQAVRGDNFWNRENELEDIWEKISTGSNILLSAPRRVGKTSIMFHLQDNPKENFFSGMTIEYVGMVQQDLSTLPTVQVNGITMKKQICLVVLVKIL